MGGREDASVLFSTGLKTSAAKYCVLLFTFLPYVPGRPKETHGLHRFPRVLRASKCTHVPHDHTAAF